MPDHIANLRQHLADRYELLCKLLVPMAGIGMFYFAVGETESDIHVMDLEY